MPIPVLVKTLAEKKLSAFCSGRIPPHAAHQVRLSHAFRGSTVTIFEHRAPWREGDTKWSAMPIAQMRYDQKTGLWTLYCADRNGRWHIYSEIDATKDIEAILSEINEDPTHIFWG
ncbi:MAG: DUF3024 domain-containing protein [Nitrospirota bacterium]